MGHADTHRTLHRLFNDRDYDAMDVHIRDEMTSQDIPRGLTTKHRDEFKDWLRGWSTAFSDAKVAEPQYHEGSDFSIARFQGRGTNDGPFGPLPASSRPMDMPFCEILHYDDDGKVTAGEIYYDQMTMLVQLGHMDPPG